MAKVTPLTVAQIEKMGQSDRVKEFVSRSVRGKAIFLEMGILRHFIETASRAKKSITAVLKEAGADAGSISNSAYAMKAFRILCTGSKPVMTVPQFYKTMTFNKCRHTVAVAGTGDNAPAKAPKHIQAPKVVAETLLTSTNAVEDLQSLGATGLTKSAADTKQAEKDQKKSDKEAKDKAANDKIIAEAKAVMDRDSGNTSGESDSEPEEESDDAPEPEIEETEEKPEETEKPEESPEQTPEPETDETPEPEKETESDKEETPEPEASEESTVTHIVASIEGLEQMIEGLEKPESIKAVYKALVGLGDMVGDMLPDQEKKVTKMPKSKAA